MTVSRSLLRRSSALSTILGNGCHASAYSKDFCNKITPSASLDVCVLSDVVHRRLLHVSGLLRGPHDTKTVAVPPLGEYAAEGTLSEWKKRVGDAVEANAAVATVKTDKDSVVVTCTLGGKVVKLHAKEGDVVSTGKPLFDVDTNPQSDAAPEAPAETRIPLSRMRLRIGERLKEAQNTAVMLTTFNECDMGNVAELRAELNGSGKYKCKLGYVSAFMKSATLALEKMPIFNSYIEGKEIVRKHSIDISVAVSTPTGLVVPVVRDCAGKTWEQLELELARVAALARDGKLTLKDMQGGTFTISNGGVYGSMLSTPILNPPQSSILGMHNITKRPVVKNDQVVIRPIMYLALSYDHRLVDGREAVQFLLEIKRGVEENVSNLV